MWSNLRDPDAEEDLEMEAEGVMAACTAAVNAAVVLVDSDATMDMEAAEIRGKIKEAAGEDVDTGRRKYTFSLLFY